LYGPEAAVAISGSVGISRLGSLPLGVAERGAVASVVVEGASGEGLLVPTTASSRDLAFAGSKIDANEPMPRPSPRQSEVDVGITLPLGSREQVSFKGGVEVPYGTPLSVRPDWCIGTTCSVEVKNYDISTNKQALIRNVSQQAVRRQQELPSGMTQQVVIDVRGQSVDVQQEINIRRGIAQQSGGVIAPSDITFKRN
jgi:filamentous hemagglutinin